MKVERFVEIETNDIHVDDDSVYDSCAITANDAEIYIAENEIVYVGHTYGSTINNAIYLNGCKAAL